MLHKIRFEILYVIGLLIFFSCSKKEELIPFEDNLYMSCGMEITNCDPLSFIPDSSNVSEILDGECFKDLGMINLVPDSKKFVWFLCPDVNNIIYEDSLGTRIELMVVNKRHTLENAKRFSYSVLNCQEFKYEYIHESIEIILKNEELDIQLKIELTPNGVTQDLYDGLEISKTNYFDSRLFWYNTVLFAYLNVRRTNLRIVRYIYSSELEIQGTIFYDVHWNDGRFNVPMEIYYNRECGLIAFRDDFGRLWKIVGYN